MKERAKQIRIAWLAGALLPLLAGFAGAASIHPTEWPANAPDRQDPPAAAVAAQGVVSGPQLEKVKDLIGAKVVNGDGERLGTITDVVLTPDRAGVNYVVLSTGWAWGLPSKYFAVPWSQVQLQRGTHGSTVVLNGVSRAQLKRAPGLDKKAWPATIGDDWLSTQRQAPRYAGAAIAGYIPPEPEGTENRGVTAANGDQGLFTAPATGEYANPGPVMTREPPSGAPEEAATQPGRGSSPNTGRFENIYPHSLPANAPSPAPEPTGPEQVRVSKLLGTRVVNPQGQGLGKLSDAMIDVSRGRLAFGIVSLRTGFLGVNKDYAPVPWSALGWTGRPMVAQLNASKQTLMAVAAPRDNFPNLGNPQYARDLEARFQATPYGEGQNLGYIPGRGE